MLQESLGMRPNGDSCPLCGCQRLLSHDVFASDVAQSDGRFTIRECFACRLAWQWPLRRKQEESIKFFDDAYAESGEQTSSYFSADRKAKIAALELGYTNSVAAKKGKLLDIGCGNGTFVAMANSDGWNAVGIDPAAPEGSVPGVYRGDLSRVRQERFDVITMWDVIEHLEDPGETLLTVKEYLQPDGVLIIETGNYLSTDRVFMGENWWAYQYDHRWYFSPDNLEKLAEKSGFETLSISDRVLRPNWSGSAEYKGPSKIKSLAKLILRPFGISHTLEQYSSLRALSQNYQKTAGLHIFACALRNKQPTGK